MIIQADMELLDSQRLDIRYAAVCEVVKHINSELGSIDDGLEQERLECKSRGYEYRQAPPRAKLEIVGPYPRSWVSTDDNVV
jgi:hypothetical protein